MGWQRASLINTFIVLMIAIILCIIIYFSELGIPYLYSTNFKYRAVSFGLVIISAIIICLFFAISYFLAERKARINEFYSKGKIFAISLLMFIIGTIIISIYGMWAISITCYHAGCAYIIFWPFIATIGTFIAVLIWVVTPLILVQKLIVNPEAAKKLLWTSIIIGILLAIIGILIYPTCVFNLRFLSERCIMAKAIASKDIQKCNRIFDCSITCVYCSATCLDSMNLRKLCQNAVKAQISIENGTCNEGLSDYYYEICMMQFSPLKGKGAEFCKEFLERPYLLYSCLGRMPTKTISDCDLMRPYANNNSESSQVWNIGSYTYTYCIMDVIRRTGDKSYCERLKTLDITETEKNSRYSECLLA